MGMMKILIVDDEKITREGIIASINWEELNIYKVLEAEDGLSALLLVKKEAPDIILSDVRMPRMDGISFVKQVRSILPNTSIIFMSGYSDKEYLMAAIKLRAVSYVEKPLNPSDIERAILEAKEEHLLQIKNSHNESLDIFQKTSLLATLLTQPYLEGRKEILNLQKELGFTGKQAFLTYIVELDSEKKKYLDLTTFILDFNHYLKGLKLKLLSTILHDSYYVFSIYGDPLKRNLLQNEIEETLIANFRPLHKFYIGKGLIVDDLVKGFHSYTAAVIALQSSYFFPVQSILKASNELLNETKPYDEFSLDSFNTFKELLLEKHEEETCDLLATIFNFYYLNPTALPSQAKGLYFRLLAILNDVAKESNVYSFSEESHILKGETQIVEALERCFSYQELHQLLVMGTKEYFQLIKDSAQEDSTINLIKDYVSRHYANEDLTVKEISEHVFLSVSYMCTYFKSQTDNTLNQYITDYRMKKALSLLKDPRIQISDIALKVGYKNSNYFTKSFKKYTGVTPSNYRENLLK